VRGADAIYDEIGAGYAAKRQPDPRIAARLHAALGDTHGVLNVGAGAGSYEPNDRSVVAVEPSATMIAQRPPGSAAVVQASADRLPFGPSSFDAALAVLTVHHWPDPAAGLAEVRRVTTGPIVVLTFDHAVHGGQWLVTDYLPAMLGLDTDVPSPAGIAEALGGGEVEILPVPADCRDGFCHAWWRRPEAYLQPGVRAAISGIARLPGPYVADAMTRLAADLATGRWQERHADLAGRTEIDAGYRLVISPGAEPDRDAGDTAARRLRGPSG
jgi:SAM-dependent methyltransferase